MLGKLKIEAERELWIVKQIKAYLYQMNIFLSDALTRHLLKNHQEPIQCYPQVSYRIQPRPLLNQEGNQEMNAGRTHQAPIV